MRDPATLPALSCLTVAMGVNAIGKRRGEGGGRRRKAGQEERDSCRVRGGGLTCPRIGKRARHRLETSSPLDISHWLARPQAATLTGVSLGTQPWRRQGRPSTVSVPHEHKLLRPHSRATLFPLWPCPDRRPQPKAAQLGSRWSGPMHPPR